MTEYLTTEQAAHELGIVLTGVRQLVDRLKLIPASGHNLRTWRFTRESIEQRKRDVIEARQRQRPSPRFGRTL
jgi:hypothetical protein